MAQRTILVKVKQSNLTLGVTKYKKGDLFECREQEALMLMHAGILERAPEGTRATRDPPMPGKTGLSNKGVPTEQQPAPQPKEPPKLPASSETSALKRKKKRVESFLSASSEGTGEATQAVKGDELKSSESGS